ncbi:hypothetical protein AYI69_g9611, partial [Smittium culicis]
MGHDDSALNFHKSIEYTKSGSKSAINGASKLNGEYLGSEASRKKTGGAGRKSEKNTVTNTGNGDLYHHS